MYPSVSTCGVRSVVVIPAYAGIQAVPPELDPGVHRDDASSVNHAHITRSSEFFALGNSLSMMDDFVGASLQV
jgi:hypothetical protein